MKAAYKITDRSLRTRMTILVFVGLVGTFPALAAPPGVPTTNEVVRYVRERPMFRSKTIPRDRGDALLAALEDSRQIQARRLEPEVVCAYPEPARHWLSLTLTNGRRYRIGASLSGGVIHLPNGIFLATGEAKERIAKVMVQLDSDFLQEIVSTPKPFNYTVGTANDGRTLPGVARLFYGDAARWKEIYDANLKVIKDTNRIGGISLTIPKLP